MSEEYTGGGSQTVYVNDNPIGETDVYHARRGHVTTLRRWRSDYTRETTASEAVEEGLRPCKQCFPVGSGQCCPSCGYEGNGDEVLAGGQRWCGNGDCRVVSFTEGDDA